MTGQPNPIAHEVVVIGAGQAGLAGGHHLRKRDLDFVILESAARVGDVWRQRYDPLMLYSPAVDDALPGMPFPKIGARFPTGRQMGDYLEAYARDQSLPVRTGHRATTLRGASGGGFIVEAGDVAFQAAQVIVATGAFQRPWVPAFAADLDPRIRQVHVADYRNPVDRVSGAGVVERQRVWPKESPLAKPKAFAARTSNANVPYRTSGKRKRVTSFGKAVQA